jgi:hypothetical protein
MEGTYQSVVHLKKGFSSSADDERLGAAMALRPLLANGGGEILGAGEPASTGPIDSEEVGVTEATRSLSAITLQARPEIATGKAAEDCRTAGIGTLSLKGIEDFLYDVGHD